MASNYKALRAAACKSDPARSTHLVFRVAVVVVRGIYVFVYVVVVRGIYTAAGEKAKNYVCTFWLEERLQSTQQQEKQLTHCKNPSSHPEK